MTAANFPVCLREILKHEGGWSNHPADLGGATMKGVTQRVYDAYRDREGAKRQTVRLITDGEVSSIYRRQYWDACRCDDLPSGVDLMVFDLAVNSGTGRAAKFLQASVGVEADGEIGPKTVAAVARFTPVSIIEAMRVRRSNFYRALPTFPTFGKGWMTRLAGVFAKANQMAGVT